MLSDTQFYNVYEIRTPYVSVRFARLRMSVRLFCKAPFDLLALLFMAKGDHRSWLDSFITDFQWLRNISLDFAFTLVQ